jgi:hypothetical protein
VRRMQQFKCDLPQLLLLRRPCSSAGGGWARCAATGAPCAPAPRKCGTRSASRHMLFCRLGALHSTVLSFTTAFPLRFSRRPLFTLVAWPAECVAAAHFGVGTIRKHCVQVELKCREDLQEVPLPPRGAGSRQPACR